MPKLKLRPFRPKPLLGAWDAWNLLGIGGAAIAAHPLLAGNLEALAAGFGAAALGGAGLALPRVRDWLDPVDAEPREGFILPSDPVLEGDGPLIGYTRDTNAPVRIPYDLFMRHLGLIGASGGGKTTLLLWILWQQMTRGGGWLFIDAKLDYDTRDTLGYLARLCGREHELYILNVNDPEYSNSYNPILSGDADEVASRLLNLQPSTENDPGADHYRQSANQALTVFVGALKACKMRYNFTDLAILLQSGPALEQLLRMTPPGAERMALDVFLDKFRKQTQAGVQIDVNKMKDTLGGMAGRIALFSQGKFGLVFNTYAPEIDLADILRTNKMLYVMLPTMAKDTAALNLGKMIVSDLRTAVARLQALPKQLRPRPPFIGALDELGSYVMPGIARLFEQARSARVALLPGFQAFGNLREVSAEFADIIMQNTWSKALFRFGGNDSAESAAEMVGKVRRYQHGLSTSESSGESAHVIRAAPQSSESASGNVGQNWSEREDYRVSPDKLGGLMPGESVLTVGARTYHIVTPLMQTPIDTLKPDDPKRAEYLFVPMRHPTRVPDGEQGLHFDRRYSEFMSS
ncbi:MAG: type IV secretory system conjugative DNA transfer family protein [Acidiferrobacterales bacterium]